MINKNNKAFTLIEIIAIIVLMGVVLTVAFSFISNKAKLNKFDKYKTYVKAVEEAAYTYADLELSDGYDDDVSLNDLISKDYLKKYIGNELSDYNNIKIHITKTGGRITLSNAADHAEQFSIEFDDNYICNKDGC